MTVADLLARLDAVRPRGPGRWTARCPAHDDRVPSLTIAAGDRAILLRCWAGCEVAAICEALGVRIRDIAYAAETDPRDLARARRERSVRRAEVRTAQVRERDHAAARREAERTIARYTGVSIEGWTAVQLDAAWERLGHAHDTLLRVRDGGRDAI